MQTHAKYAKQRQTPESHGRQSYHQDDQHEKDNWNDDVDDVEERFAIQINSELDARIVDTQVCAEAAMTMNVRSDHLPYIYNSRITLLIVTRCSAIAERLRYRVRYSFGQKWQTGTERQYFTDIIGLSSTTVI